MVMSVVPHSEDQLLFPEEDGSCPDGSDIKEISTSQCNVRTKLELKKLVRSQTQLFRAGKNCCIFCRLPKYSKRSRLIYSRFVCPCDIDLYIEGEEVEFSKPRYGVDAVLENRHMFFRDNSEDSHLIDRLSYLLSLLSVPEKDTDPALSSSSSLTTVTPRAFMSSDPASELGAGRSVSDSVKNRPSFTRYVADQNNSAMLPIKQNEESVYYLASDCSPIAHHINSDQYGSICIKAVVSLKEMGNKVNVLSSSDSMIEIATLKGSQNARLSQQHPVVIHTSTSGHTPNTNSYSWSEMKCVDHGINGEKLISTTPQPDATSSIMTSRFVDLMPFSGRRCHSFHEHTTAVTEGVHARGNIWLWQSLYLKLHLHQRNILHLQKQEIKMDRNPENVCSNCYWHGSKCIKENKLKRQGLLKREKLRLKHSNMQWNQPIYFNMPTSCQIHCATTHDNSCENLIQDDITEFPEPDCITVSRSLILKERNNSNDAVSQNDTTSTPGQHSGRVVRVEGDGRCLFRSLVTGLIPRLQDSRRDDFGRPERRQEAEEETARADDLRASVVRLMKDNLHFYSQLESGIINADQPMPMNYQKFLDRLEAMSKHNTMPGDLELNAAAMVLERQILVLNVDLRQITVYGQDRYPESRPLAVRYTKLCADVGHYDAVILDYGCGQSNRNTSSSRDSHRLSLSHRDFSRLTIRDNQENRSPGHGGGSDNSRRSSPTKNQFSFHRNVLRGIVVGDPVSNPPRSNPADVSIHNFASHSFEKQSPSFRPSRTASRATTKPPSATLTKRSCQFCGGNPLMNKHWSGTDKGTQTSREKLDNRKTFTKKRKVHDGNLKKQYPGFRSHGIASGENLLSDLKGWHQNMNQNRKITRSKKRRSQAERYRETRNRKRKFSRQHCCEKRKTLSTASKFSEGQFQNLFVGSGNTMPNGSQENRCYKRRAVAERRNAKKRRIFEEDLPDKGVKPLPPRLPEAFSIGQCRCLLCRKKVVSSTHSWVKCYLCGRVAHRECVTKNSPNPGTGGDDDDIYFLCQKCVPV